MVTTVEAKKVRRTFPMTTDEYHQHVNDSDGACLGCFAWTCGVEPDAEKYDCEACGDPRVYGIESLLMRGRVVIHEHDRPTDP